MCGIAGIIHLQNKEPVDEAIIESMTNSMAHRGPDGYGLYSNRFVQFGHRRLSIIDISSAGKQPMCDTDNRFVITFNGEIYNFREIRKSLGSCSYQSETDTEVILNAFAAKGIRCIDDFIGMFGFAISNIATGESFIVRDRIGVKPLYYSEFDGKFIFASEMKAILKYPGFSYSHNMNGLSSYLSYRYPIGEQTYFNEIKSLLPGHFIRINNGKYSIEKYYDLPIVSATQDLGETYYIDRIRELLDSAISYRMISDVPVGAYLSGGVDSSIVSALMSMKTDHQLKTFTIGFDEPGYNEFHYANEIATKYNTDHYEINMSSGGYLDSMIDLIKYKDAPLSVPNEPALYVMSKELKKHITVVLSGEGADEIFGGYGRLFRSPLDYQRYKAILEYPDFHDDSPLLTEMKDNLNSKYENRVFKTEFDHFLEVYQYINWHEKQLLFHPNVVSFLNNDYFTNSIISNQYDQLKALTHYEKYLWVFEKFHILGLLHRVDTTTMAASVEARVPFVDHRLVEFAMTIPIKYKLHWKSILHQAAAYSKNSDQISEVYDDPKYILKKAYENELTPGVTWRRKMGFPVPLQKWFGSDFNKFAKEILLDDQCMDRGVFNTKYLEKFINEVERSGNHKSSLKLWMLVNIELWFSEYFN